MQAVRILIIGGGFGGVYALRRFHRLFHGSRRVQVTLVNERNHFLFTPLLHEVASGGVRPENVVEPIRKVLGCCLHRFHVGRAGRVSLASRVVEAGDVSLPYDYLVLATGAETNFYGIPGAREHAFALKSLEHAVRLKNHCIGQVERAIHLADRSLRRQALRFVVVGGGPTGVEFAAELQEFLAETFSHYYPRDVLAEASVVLVQRAGELLPQFGPKVRAKSLEALRRKGVRVMLNAGVAEVGRSRVLLDSGERMPAETVVWVAGVKPAGIDFAEPVPRAPDGKVRVNEFLQIAKHPEVFVIGDAAAFEGPSGFLPALAQVAVKEAEAAAENIARIIAGKPPLPFAYRHAGNLVSLGQWMAAGEISRFAFWGHLTWWLWRTVYLSKLISWRKKITVAVDWTINLFSPRDIAEL